MDELIDYLEKRIKELKEGLEKNNINSYKRKLRDAEEDYRIETVKILKYGDILKSFKEKK